MQARSALQELLPTVPTPALPFSKQARSALQELVPIDAKPSLPPALQHV